MVEMSYWDSGWKDPTIVESLSYAQSLVKDGWDSLDGIEEDFVIRCVSPTEGATYYIVEKHRGVSLYVTDLLDDSYIVVVCTYFHTKKVVSKLFPDILKDLYNQSFKVVQQGSRKGMGVDSMQNQVVFGPVR